MDGMVQTVLGAIKPEQLGATITHEHLLHSLPHELYEHPLPPKLQHLKDAPVVIENLPWIRQYPYCFKANTLFTEEVVREAVKDELIFFKECGGGTIVDVSSIGVRAENQHSLATLSKATDVNIIMGTGFYVEGAMPSSLRSLSVEAMAQKIRDDIFVGLNDSGVKCGVIGEIGCSWPLLPFEKRSLVASAIVQSESGCPVTVHPGRNPKAPEEIIRVYLEAGGKADRLVMGHIDRTVFCEDDLFAVASFGTFCEFDLFGIEVSHYQHNEEVDMPSDAQRIAMIRSLVKENYGKRILLSHDIHSKHRIMKYGGHGFSHILVNVVPKMLKRGLTEEDVNDFLINNPKQWLTFH